MGAKIDTVSAKKLIGFDFPRSKVGRLSLQLREPLNHCANGLGIVFVDAFALQHRHLIPQPPFVGH